MVEQASPMFPTVHLNGTSGAALLESLEQAQTALTAALVMLGQAAPNARDYYVYGPKTFGVARDQHDDRVERLLSVRREVEKIYEKVYEQVDRSTEAGRRR